MLGGAHVHRRSIRISHQKTSPCVHVEKKTEAFCLSTEFRCIKGQGQPPTNRQAKQRVSLSSEPFFSFLFFFFRTNNLYSLV